MAPFKFAASQAHSIHQLNNGIPLEINFDSILKILLYVGLKMVV